MNGTHRKQPAVRRRAVLWALVSAVAWTSCYEDLYVYPPCPDTTSDEEDGYPPCPEAGVEDAGLDGDAPDADQADGGMEDSPSD
ncbi:MAG: hypothetical protein R3B70_43080 [Polyangiaceae bacterium]